MIRNMMLCAINEQFFKKSKEDEYLTTGSPSVLFVSAEQMFIQMKEKSTDRTK